VVQDFTRGTVAGDAVAEHAAQFVVIIEHGGGDALAAQLVGRGHAGGAAADDGDLLVAGQRTAGELVAFFVRGVTDELFNGVDADEIFDFVAVATILARRGTDAAHHGGEGVGVGGTLEGVFLPVHVLRRLFDAAHDLQIAADVFPGRAAALARRGTVHIGGALVGVVTDEDLVGETVPRVFAIFKTTERQFFHVVTRSCHAFSPVG
jgi:hypothetical protein